MEAQAMNVRHAVAALLAASVTFPAFGRDIPPALLAHEAKLLAALTPAQKARLSGLESHLTPNMSVQDVLAVANANGFTGSDSAFLMLLELQKMLNRDALEAKKEHQEAIAAKRAENMREAEEMATRLMNTATTSLATGVSSGARQVAGAAQLGPTPTPTPHGLVVIRK
jgi:hypothetical protein